MNTPKTVSRRRRRSPRPKRDFKAEYERRVSKGLSKGLSRSQARGHARAGERPKAASPVKLDPRRPEELALKLMKKGVTLRAAALTEGVTKERLRRYLKENTDAKRVGWNRLTAKAAPADAGDIWTWTGIDADSKLIVSYLVGDRSGAAAIDLMDDLRSRLVNRVQLSTDGHRAYLDAVEGAFGGDVDYGLVIKQYGATPTPAGRYSPAECIAVKTVRVEGSPDPAHISTSFVEVHNKTMRMHMRRFTRLTNGHSKKVANHAHMVAL